MSGISGAPISGAPIAAGLDAEASGTLEDLASSADVLVVGEPSILPSLQDAFSAADLMSAASLPTLRDRVIAASSVHAVGIFKNNLAASGSFSDAIRFAWDVLLADTTAASDSMAGTVTRLAAIVDTLRATGLADSKLSAIIALAAAATADDIASSGWNKNLSDAGQLADIIAATTKHIAALLDSAAASDSSLGIMQITALLADSADVGADAAVQAFLQSDLSDSAMVYATIRIQGEDYSAWMMNTDLRAFTERRGVSFDSVVDAGGRHFAAGPDGIFEITGDTDAGEPMDAWLRTFLSDFGTAKMKRLPDVYVGYSGANMLLKVRTRNSATGELLEDWYTVERRQVAGDGNGIAKVGRGLKSVWWALELHNIAGADFDIDNINWRPLVLDRRT